jgi:hypothetical protein
MGKLGSGGSVLICLLALLGLAGCGSSNPIKTVSYPVPANITLTPTPAASMEVGSLLTFTAAALNSSKQTLTEPLYFQSSDPTVVTIASNGLACAGIWDSTTNPTVCTAGRVGVAQITATAQGVTSPTATVYVHQHIDSITLKPAANQQSSPCQSVSQTFIYEAHAFGRGIDITSTAGQFSWAALNSKVATLSNTVAGLANMVDGVSLNQVQVTASIPGTTPLYATVGTAASVPVNFVTCPVQSIVLAVNTSTGSTQQITPTVTDVLGNTILNVPLTYSSSQPASVSVSSSGAVSGTAGTGGAATVIASCTPPTCNIGFMPSLPVYPQNVVTQVVSAGSTAPSGTVYVTSTGCAGVDNCFTALVPITYPANTLGTLAEISPSPNSFLFARQGGQAYLGTKSGIFSGGYGLTILNVGGSNPTASQVPGAPGKVLAVSPDGLTVIVSDTVNTPNQVYIVNAGTFNVTAYSISGATAADFSPDSLKAFIVAGDNLYIVSKLDHLQTISLSAPANDVSFLPEGAFGVLAGGSASGITAFRTCDDGGPFSVATTPAPTFLRPLLGASQLIPFDTTPNYHFLALDSPNIDIISVHTTPTGCTPTLTGDVMSYNLGHGNFTASQLLVSEDGSRAYIVSPSLNDIPVFSTTGLTSSSIALTGNVTPVQATLTPDGGHLYVAASDGNVHVLDTNLGADILQITFPQNFCLTSSGQNEPFICKPDLIAVKP